MHDAVAGRQPLHVAAAVARGRAERVGVIDETLAHDRHGLEAAMRMLRESGHHVAVVHAEAVLHGEVHADFTTRERHGRSELVVALRIVVVVMRTEEEGVERLPQEPEGLDPENHVLLGLHFHRFLPFSVAASRKQRSRYRHDRSERGSPIHLENQHSTCRTPTRCYMGAVGRGTQKAQSVMLKISLISLAVILGSMGSSGCAADTGNEDDSYDSEDQDLLKKTASTSSWSYRGLMPRLDSPELTVSLKGHTVHVAGYLPASFQGQLPFYARTEQVNGRTKVHVAYPIATVNPNGTLPSGVRTRNPEPFTYKICGGDNHHATNSTGDFGGFPFVEYICGHRDADGRVRSGIAFHGPITATNASGANYWSLLRGPVSHACNRMLGEHVLELAHVTGFDKGAQGQPVKVIADFDTFNGQPLDVDYASTNWTRPANGYVFPIWQAVKLRADGSTQLDFPQWACETSRCASMPPNARDPYTGNAI